MSHAAPDHTPSAAHAPHPSVNLYLVVFALLLLLLIATVAVAEINLGRWNFISAAAIATVKATLIALYFMHLRYSSRLTWLVAAAGVIWLSLLIGLTAGDFFTRSWVPYWEEAIPLGDGRGQTP